MNVKLIMEIRSEEEYHRLVEYYTRAINKTIERGDAGIDLFVTCGYNIMPHESVRIDHEVGIRLKHETLDMYFPYMLISRSSTGNSHLVMKNSIGLIDQGYTGNLISNFLYFGKEQLAIMKFQRLVQLTTFGMHKIVGFEIVANLGETERGKDGFGSTGQ